MVFLQGTLEIEILEIKDLPDFDTSCFRSEKDVSDPYVTVNTVVGEKSIKRILKTKVIKNTLNPKWDQKCRFKISHEAESFKFAVKDKDFLKDKCIGDVSIPAEDLNPEEPISGFFDVTDCDGNPAGSMNIKMKYKPSKSKDDSDSDSDSDIRKHKDGHTKHHWGYCEHNGCATWSTMGYPLADGLMQSPIDIIQDDENCLEQVDDPLIPLYKKAVVYDIINNGHSWKARMSKDKRFKSILKGGPLSNEFVLQQFHAHWGKTSETGSEHRVNGQQFCGELHMVHWNKDKYNTMEIAKKHSDGLAVLSRLIQIGEEEHPELNKICQLLPFIQHKGQFVEVKDAIDVTKFIPEKGSYWTYNGSLTTPACYESVTWMLYKDPLIVTEEQMDYMRQMKTYNPIESCPEDEFEGKMVENYRPPCPMGERILREYNETEEQTKGTDSDSDAEPEETNHIHKDGHHKGHWGYCGDIDPTHWAELGIMAPGCATGAHQSPIDIKNYDKDCPMYQLTPVYKNIFVSEIRNNGHTWHADVTKSKKNKKRAKNSLKGGPLSNEYTLVQFHGHWGMTNETGSEHKVKGKQYCGEIHMVHKNKKYATGEEAKKHPDGLAVVSRLLQVGEEEHPEVSKICKLLPSIQHKGQKLDLEKMEVSEAESINPAAFIPKKGSFWTYEGSLTTPGCNECVTWIVFQEPLIVTEEQMVSMRNMKTYHPMESCPENAFEGQMVENYRPICDLGTRIIKKFNANDSDSSDSEPEE